MTNALSFDRVPRCPISRSQVVERVCDGDGYSIWHCPESGTRFMWPAPEKGAGHLERRPSHSEAEVDEILSSIPQSGEAPYLLEIGCGDGAHLAMAASRGWKCFGVEADERTRTEALERHGEQARIVSTIDELIPHAFDLILMFDIVEHVSDPYAWLFSLFNAGAIGPGTHLVITTADGDQPLAALTARLDCSRPPSDLVHHTARSLRQLFAALLFDRIDVRRIDVSTEASQSSLEATTQLQPRLRCDASGSRFYAFMLERYVPGTWSKLAEYEHVPRYQFARRFAAGARVLDFGCGTGYGSRFLADVADDVLGLDIDEDALTWATFWHDRDRLRFERHADLGASLPAASFDLVTCFEMIEHVDHATQVAAIANFARLVRTDGKLLISTPNPAVTINYGDNPFHLREMNEAEFVALLAPHFEHLAVYRQWVRPSILIGTEPIPATTTVISDRLGSGSTVDEPPAFIAVCSHRPLKEIEPFVSFDGSFDMVLAETRLQKTLTRLRFESYLLGEARDDAERRARQGTEELIQRRASERLHVDALEAQVLTIDAMRRSFDEQADNIEALRVEIASKDAALQEGVRSVSESTARVDAMQLALDEQEDAIGSLREGFAAQAGHIEALRLRLEEDRRTIDDRTRLIANLEAALQERDQRLAERTAEKDALVRQYTALENTRFVRLARLMHGNSGSRAPLVEVSYLIAGGLIPRSMKARLAPLASRLRKRFSRRAEDSHSFAPYRVKPPTVIRASRPRVLHVIANFMTGGSSRLVVDLLEHLGGEYEQRILTSFIPTPAHFADIDITQVGDPADLSAMGDLMKSFDPHVVHVHYWGDCDEPWYRSAYGVAHQQGCLIVQNVNTPVAPFADVPVARNVFVSRYVLDHFGTSQPHDTVIYPGSDFALFSAGRRLRRTPACIGMVYRLERDKLDEASIEPFIEAARSMSELNCLIVGGGSLLQGFKDRVRAEGLDGSFEFTGYVSYESLPALYRRMDVFVAPIWKESFGQVSAFAMNMGIPVIGYDVGAIPEIVADPSLVAQARDARSLAAIAVGLVRDDAARASIGVANRERAARMFSVEAMIGSYRALYRDLMRQ